jgi:hypothetical protein
MDEGWGNSLLNRYDERPEWSDVTSIIRTHSTFSSPQRLHQILRVGSIFPMSVDAEPFACTAANANPRCAVQCGNGSTGCV